MSNTKNNKLSIHESGEANHYTILDGKDWVMTIQYNGEKPIPDQRLMLGQMIKAPEMLNALIEFCERVEKGEVPSVKTYQKFKQLIKEEDEKFNNRKTRNERGS